MFIVRIDLAQNMVKLISMGTEIVFSHPIPDLTAYSTMAIKYNDRWQTDELLGMKAIEVNLTQVGLLIGMVKVRAQPCNLVQGRLRRPLL